MKTHVFIVDEHSFPIHLQYLFAGTGAADANEHIGLLADIQRVRPGDRVIFYLQTNEKSGLDGGFYGAFIVSDLKPLVIYDSANPTFLENSLGKKLIYRVRIEPADVYTNGVVEYRALDDLPRHSINILWSLIYRKLKGWRGCTPLTNTESDRLMDLIRQANNNQSVQYGPTDGFTYSLSSQKIQIVPAGRKQYNGQLTSAPPIITKIFSLAQAGKAFEIYLQAYFTENAGLGINLSLDQITGQANKIIWLGNEVKCGVGMRSIDIFCTLNLKGNINQHRIIELKDEQVNPNIIHQIFKYVNWTQQYIHGATNTNIQPIIVALEIPNLGSNRLKRKKFDTKGQTTIFWQNIRNAFNSFNARNLAMPILYNEYSVQNQTITFNPVQY